MKLAKTRENQRGDSFLARWVSEDYLSRTVAGESARTISGNASSRPDIPTLTRWTLVTVSTIVSQPSKRAFIYVKVLSVI